MAQKKDAYLLTRKTNISPTAIYVVNEARRLKISGYKLKVQYTFSAKLDYVLVLRKIK